MFRKGEQLSDRVADIQEAIVREAPRSLGKTVSIELTHREESERPKTPNYIYIYIQ